MIICILLFLLGLVLILRAVVSGQRDQELGAFAQLGMNLDHAAHADGNVLDDRKAQTGAAHRTGTALVNAVEAVEEPLKVDGVDGGVIIHNREDGVAEIRL